MKARPYVSSYTSFSKAKNLVPSCMHFRSYLRKWINCRYAYRGTFFYDSLKFKLHRSRVLGRKNTGNRKLFLPASTRKRSFFRTKGEKDLSSDRGVKSDSQGWLFKEYLLGSYSCTSIWGHSDIWGWFRNMSPSKRFPCHLLLNWGRQTNVPGGKAARPHIHKRKIRKFKLDPWMVKGNICGNLQGFFILEGFKEEGRSEPKMGSPVEPEMGGWGGGSHELQAPGPHAQAPVDLWDADLPTGTPPTTPPQKCGSSQRHTLTGKVNRTEQVAWGVGKTFHWNT